MSQDTAKVVALTKPGAVSNTEVAARVTVLGAIGTGLFTIVDKATQNPAVMAAILGSVAMIPAVGQAVIALGAIIAVGVYAAKFIKEQFSKYLKMLRTIDEFTILLHKIQKISNLTIFISTTYNFDINIDEVIEQMKIIFSRFDEVLKLEPNSYNKIESQVMNPLTATPDIEEEAQGAITRAAMLEIKSNDPSQELPTGQKGGGFDGVDGEYDSQTGGAPLWWERFQFNVQAWNKNLNTDIIKLNIYLTTTMSEFSIILNVIQMNMIVNGLGQNPQEKTKAITELTKKNFVIKYSSEYQKTRIGILLHDILKLRVDLVYCKEQAGKSPLVSKQSDAVCKEHIAKYNTGYMFTTFRSDLHRFINKLIIRLKDGDYDNALKQSVCNNVLLPYSNMLNKARLVAPTDKREVLDAFEVKSLTPQNVADINAKLDEFIAGIPKNLAMLTVPAPGAAPALGNGKPVMTGGLFDFGSSKPVGDLNPTETAAEWNARIAKMDKDKKSLNLLMAEPYNLVTDDELNLFLRNIYDYTKKVSQTKPEEIKKALEVAEEMTRPPPAKTVFGSVTAAASNALNNITQSISPDTKEKIDAAKQVAAQKLGDVKSAASDALNNLTQSISPDAKEKIDAAKQVAADKAAAAKQVAAQGAAAAKQVAAQGAAAAKNFFSGLLGKSNTGGGNRRLTRKRARDVKRKTYRYKVKI
jgi:hypothetical protein